MSWSSEELTWLQASALIDPPIEGDDNPCDSASSTSLSNSISFDSSLYLPNLPTSRSTPAGLGASNSPVECYTQNYARASKPPRPEWIYRRPKPPVHLRSNCPSPSPPRLKGRTMQSSLFHSNLTARAGTSFGRSPGNNAISYAADPFSSVIFHPRSHSEHSRSPSLKNVKSQSETAPKRTPSSSSRFKISSPKLMLARPPSISSSSSISTSTSRSSSPRTPASSSSSPYSKSHRPLPYRPHPENDSTLSPLSSSCPQPSKSILTRTSSISTKDSSFTGNKSVKFAAAPVVHYATASYWDLETFDKEETTMGINVDAMDVDDSFHGYHTHIALPKSSSGMLDIAKLRESQCATPTPEREKARTKGLKRFVSLTKKPLATATTSTSAATVYRSSLSPRPIISMPYPLGAHPISGLQSNVSLPYSAASAAGSAPDLVTGTLPLRSAPSLESFRSSKSFTARSVRSMGSVKSSTSSTRGLRAWLSRATGWTWSGQPPEC